MQQSPHCPKKLLKWTCHHPLFAPRIGYGKNSEAGERSERLVMRNNVVRPCRDVWCPCGTLNSNLSVFNSMRVFLDKMNNRDCCKAQSRLLWDVIAIVVRHNRDCWMTIHYYDECSVCSMAPTVDNRRMAFVLVGRESLSDKMPSLLINYISYCWSFELFIKVFSERVMTQKALWMVVRCRTL